MKKIILGCGDIGRRIALALHSEDVAKSMMLGLVRSKESQQQCAKLGIASYCVDLDHPADVDLPAEPENIQSDKTLYGLNLTDLHQAQLFYTIAPQNEGLSDRRSENILARLNYIQAEPAKAVVISTTGVYGDCDGQWVTEQSATKPVTKRGQRRLDLESQWLSWGELNSIPVVILRVPGIYAHSRLPRERIAKRTPVVTPSECGYTNRIHADDLARVCIKAMQQAKAGEIFNVTDGTPGKISEYLQVVSQALGQPPLPEISMTQAQSLLSKGMLSYLSESRKISNQKMLEQLHIDLMYPDFREGVKV